MWAPSRRSKFRTQPTWSERSAPSMCDRATTGCHASWLLKSRSTAHTRSTGASMMADRVTRCIVSATAEIAFQCVEPALEDALTDVVGELALLIRRCVELGRPFGEAAVAVG